MLSGHGASRLRRMQLANRRSAIAFAATLAAISLIGCGGGDGGARADAGSDARFVSCVGDPRADAYRPGLAKAGSAGAYTVTLVDAQPITAEKGTNRWTIRVTDVAGAPVDGMTIAVVPFMPDHNHGSSMDPVVRPSGSPGEYVVDPLYFFMLGLWRVTLTLTPPAPAAADVAVFHACVES